MLRVFVVSQNGVPPASPLSAVFGEGIGSIGREDVNALILPDPHKHISRVQAQVKCLSGEYFLVDQGGNPTSVNGRPLGKGNVASLHDGDRIEMAEWILHVETVRPAPVFSDASAPATSDPLGLLGAAPVETANPDPLAALLGIPSAPEPAAFAPPPASSVPPQAAVQRKASDDPFSIFSVVAAPTAKAPVAAPENLDPFAAFGTPAAAPRQPVNAQASSDDPLGLGLGVNISQPAGASSVDSLFGLDGKSGSDPFANSTLADPQLQVPSAANSQDPLALLMGTDAGVVMPTGRNDSSLLNDAFVPPQAVAPEDEFDFNLPTQIVVGTPDNPGTAKTPSAAWGQASSQPEMQAASKAAPALPLQAPLMARAAEPQAEARVSVQPPAAPLPGVASVASGDSAELLAAFLRGLGVPNLNPPGGLTPELAEHIGVMLRESVQGTVELLVARAATKREVRAEMTMIVSKNNNPLKFSPDVNFALHQLLQPAGSKGFLPPVEAMRDAYDDLRAHQIGFIAGMRGALAGILGRFRPAELEARLSDKSFLDSVLPANRKAKLWDSYEQRYADILREAEDDFHSLFGREFLRAYEEQIDRLSSDRTPQ